jgi:hypothetical protein
MPGKQFVGIGEFQEIYQDPPSTRDTTHSNPLDLPNNTQAVPAFVVDAGADGVADTFELSIHDTATDQTFHIGDLGEYVCYDDGSANRVE